jgi:hypothetical protein
MGAQDSGGMASDFVNDYGVFSFPMYWDETFESWAALGVSSQPTAILLSPDGEPLAGWRGRFPEDEVLQLAAGA